MGFQPCRVFDLNSQLDQIPACGWDLFSPIRAQWRTVSMFQHRVCKRWVHDQEASMVLFQSLEASIEMIIMEPFRWISWLRNTVGHWAFHLHEWFSFFLSPTTWWTTILVPDGLLLKLPRLAYLASWLTWAPCMRQVGLLGCFES